MPPTLSPVSPPFCFNLCKAGPALCESVCVLGVWVGGHVSLSQYEPPSDPHRSLSTWRGPEGPGGAWSGTSPVTLPGLRFFCMSYGFVRRRLSPTVRPSHGCHNEPSLLIKVFPFHEQPRGSNVFVFLLLSSFRLIEDCAADVPPPVITNKLDMRLLKAIEGFILENSLLVLYFQKVQSGGGCEQRAKYALCLFCGRVDRNYLWRVHLNAAHRTSKKRRSNNYSSFSKDVRNDRKLKILFLRQPWFSLVSLRSLLDFLWCSSTRSMFLSCEPGQVFPLPAADRQKLAGIQDKE